MSAETFAAHPPHPRPWPRSSRCFQAGIDSDYAFSWQPQELAYGLKRFFNILTVEDVIIIIIITKASCSF
jgi:hypothetical protein